MPEPEGGSGTGGGSPKVPVVPPRFAVGFDVGGQSVKAAVVSAEGRVVAESREPTGPRTTERSLIDSCRRLLDHVLNMAGLAPAGPELSPTLGVGIAGVLDSRGRLTGCPNLPLLEGLPLADSLSAGLGFPVAVENDVHCAALAEARVGAAATFPGSLTVAVGTGLGAGLVLEGELYTGVTGFGCELGHMLLVPDGRSCGCGNRGCLEAYVSEVGLRGRIGEIGGSLELAVAARTTGRTGAAAALSALANEGSPEAEALVRETARYFGLALGSAVNVLDVPVIVVGGGLAPMLLGRREVLETAIGETLFARSLPEVAVLPAACGPAAGAVGAALLALLRPGLLPSGLLPSGSGGLRGPKLASGSP